MFAYWLYDKMVHSLPRVAGYVGITNNLPLRMQQHSLRGHKTVEWVAAKFGVSGAYISRIQNRKRRAYNRGE